MATVDQRSTQHASVNDGPAYAFVGDYPTEETVGAVREFRDEGTGLLRSRTTIFGGAALALGRDLLSAARDHPSHATQTRTLQRAD